MKATQEVTPVMEKHPLASPITKLVCEGMLLPLHSLMPISH